MTAIHFRNVLLLVILSIATTGCAGRFYHVLESGPITMDWEDVGRCVVVAMFVNLIVASSPIVVVERAAVTGQKVVVEKHGTVRPNAVRDYVAAPVQHTASNPIVGVVD